MGDCARPEGDHWQASVAQPPIPEVLRVPQKQTGGGVSGLWRHDWANREYIQQEADFPQTKVFDAGCAFIHKNHAEDNWLLQVETFDPARAVSHNARVPFVV